MKAASLFIRFLILAASMQPLISYSNERVVGLPCEGCEAVFEGRPATLATTARIGTANEPGEKMRIEGVVMNQAQQPIAGVVVYAYQTNQRGIYPTDERVRGKASHRHGTLRAWAITDAAGRYTFETIRPGAYPGTDLPQHIHMHIIEPNRCTYYIDDVMFLDDAKLTPKARKQLTAGRGGDGVVMPTKRDMSWVVRRNITLGEKINGYADCAPRN